jgi:HAD superfamily hydrolase (TIGR01509 family)
MQSKYKLLILDYGGVYSFPYTSRNFNKIILKTFGRLPNEEERLRIIEKSHLLGEDKITTKEYVSALSEILHVTKLPSVEQFESATIEVTNPPTPEMVELVNNVRKAGIKVSLLSDMYMFEVQLTKPWGRYERFDYVSFSAEAGMTKWNPLFFKKTLDHFQLLAQDTLFVDDVIKNVEVAKKIGLSTLFADKEKYKDVSSLVAEIYQRLGIEQVAR